jgi:hypothetical protein
MPASPPFPAVHALADHAIILAYREDTSALEAALRAEGFSVEVQRATYSAGELEFSRTIRCLLNHQKAWQKAAARARPTVIVEGDFVPCRGFGRAPAPFDPARHGPLAWAFLYAGGPRFTRGHPDGALEGHAACPVALLLSPAAAPLLVRYAEEELARCDPRAHSMWDALFQWYVMGWGGRCFLPWKHFGEHGGRANPEHAAARIGWTGRLPFLSRLNLFNNHHAECLLAPLHFLPPYADGSRLRFLAIRSLARLIGWVRLLRGRVVLHIPEATPAEYARARRAAWRRLLP